MSTQQFQASKLFDKTGAKESGWDDWDWVDNSNHGPTSNPNYAQTVPHPLQVARQQNAFSIPQPLDAAPNIALFNSNQQQQPQQLSQQQHQPHYAPQVNSQLFQEQQYPLPVQTPTTSQISLSNPNNNFNDHFSTINNNNTVNWTNNGPFHPPPPPILNPQMNISPFAGTQQHFEPVANSHSLPPPPFVDPRKSSLDNSNIQAASIGAVQNAMAQEYQKPSADDLNHARANPHLSHIQKEHTLTPQWSTESQMSYTSSDRSLSENEPNSRPFSNQSTAEDGLRIQHHENSAEITNQYGGYVQVENFKNNGQLPALQQESLPPQEQIPYQGEPDDFFNQNLAPPQEFAQLSIQNTPSPPLPAPPTVDLLPMANVPTPLPPPSLNQSPYANSNPFKRVGQHTHKLVAASAITPAIDNQNNVENVAQLPQIPRPLSTSSATHQEPVVPDSVEIAPHNDRNQYLQTGYFSEDYPLSAENSAGAIVTSPQQFYNNVDPIDSSGDHLPPPGLSRFVLGEPEIDSSQSSEIPPGLDRMIPGTELTGTLNLERQADGQDTSTPVTLPIRNTVHFSSNSSHSQSQLDTHVHAPVVIDDDVSDRNLYLVPGESETSTNATAVSVNPNIERVVTGLENVQSHQQPTQMPFVEQQRELVADGENLDDVTSQGRQLPPAVREEPIEGANTLDNIQSSLQPQPTVSNLAEADSIEALDTASNTRKYHSNNSTGNDESDKEKPQYNRRGSNSRRGDDRQRKRGDKQDTRYETEDTDYGSTRDRRKLRDNREGDRDRTKNKERTDDGGRSYRRDRERSDRYREDSREREDKYQRERGYRDNYRDSRYETDGSRYETEDTRYDRTLRRRGDRDRDHGKSSRDERSDRRFRRGEEERSDRERKPDERYRRDDQRYSEYESGDFSQRARGHPQKDRRRERGALSDREGASAVYSGYYPQQTQTGFGYDAYQSYIQQQQYYENLRRTNPHAYAEWYKHYFGGGQYQNMTAAAAAAATEERARESGRESVHSGRSSSKDHERFMFSSSHNIYNTHNLSHRVSHEQFSSQHNSTMLDAIQQPNLTHFGGPRSFTSISHIGQTSLRNHGQSQLDSLAYIDNNAEPERMTPFKYAANHCSASIQNGVMVCIKPKYSSNDSANVVNLLTFGPNDSAKRLYQTYPGPLFRGPTHKKQVIEFCQEQIRLGPPNGSVRSISNSMASLQSLEQPNKTSYTLIWNLLVLLLRQNGTVVGTDIAELLLKNKEEFPYEQQPNSLKSSDNDENSRHSAESETKQLNEENLSEDSPSEELSLNQNEITDKFRNYLLYGSIIEALDYASDNNLWGHALFLASKMDRRTHANVMMKFANKLSLSDPLQTLYQLMSGRTPSSVTCVQDERWGDWRPHLAMIISNTSAKPDVDRKAITTLGDSLHNRGDLYAAQFCYLMAQVNFGRYCDVNQESHLMLSSSNAVRLILLGSSPRKNFREFATDEAIIMTEIYEYACALADENFSIVELQPYKFLLGTRMLDYGLHLKALMYMEQISSHIKKNASKYERSFVERVYVLADKLKYYDPALEKNIDDLADDEGLNSPNNSGGQQQWQQDLLNIIGQTQTNYNAMPSANVTDSNHTDVYKSQQEINDEFANINKKFSDLNMQYTHNYYQTEQPLSLPPNVPQEQPTLSLDPNSNHFYHQPDTNNQYNNVDNNHQSPYGQPSIPSISDIGYSSLPYGEQQPPQQQQQPPFYQPIGGDGSLASHEPSPYDHYEAPKPTISMPNSMSNKPGFYDDDSSKSTAKRAQGKSGGQDDKKQALIGKSQTDANQSGWFGIGGIWNKLSMKPKNQMILPDDKNPAIVWDPENKKWINTDQDAVEEEVFRPPPKMADLGKISQPQQQQQQQQQHQHQQQHQQQPLQTQTMPPSASAPIDSGMQQNVPDGKLPSVNQVYGQTDQNGQLAQNYPPGAPSTAAGTGNNNTDPPAKVPNLQSNMFKMQRNKTLKKSYVDVFNPSGAPMKVIEPILAPTMPTATPQNFFVPAVQNNEQKSDEPMFYNPNQFNGGYQQ